jgi:hypothetical protein
MMGADHEGSDRRWWWGDGGERGMKRGEGWGVGMGRG